MYVFNVSVSIRKGFGPEWITKNFTQAYDDLPEEVTEDEVKKMAIEDTERLLYNSEDFPLYGKNWVIEGIYSA